MEIPKKVNLSKTITDRARFPVSRREYMDRTRSSESARAFDGIAASVMLFIFHKVKGHDVGDCSIDTLCYAHFANHQIIDEVLWGFEECGQKLGLKRHGYHLRGQLTMEKKKEFLRLIEKQVAAH